ncbi:hypothetical protein BZA77DRAFT_313870 [Pyronema omphalodes]|nr:hypothetical protein BZA77DRAFT_313870 [Pyronema omphalodes]
MLQTLRRLLSRRARTTTLQSANRPIATSLHVPTPPPPPPPLPRSRPVGDISSIFPSLSGRAASTLPTRFADIKQSIISGHEPSVQASWKRLLPVLRNEVDKIIAQGPSIIPSIPFSSLSSITPAQITSIRQRGCVVIRDVLPKSLALDLKHQAQTYISLNRPRVRAFPADDPAVYELYWSPPQVTARSHPNVIATQKFLQSLWHSSDSQASLATDIPITYADRFRIRHPGDAKFALGPHVDGGSLERWEDPEYRSVYKQIFSGDWEKYDPYDAAHRVTANMDLYEGPGACSMFRMFQGWLSLSSTAPGEGTLRLLPSIRETTAYFLLRPFFENGRLQLPPTTTLHGAAIAAAQEFTNELHPELRLDQSMVSIPRVEPGDYVAWHCDMLHSVDKEHRGRSDSSVFYIPATPLSEGNVRALVNQRNAAMLGVPPPDFPGHGEGEKGFFGGIDWNVDGTREMGMGRKGWKVEEGMSVGAKRVVEMANKELGFEK